MEFSKKRLEVTVFWTFENLSKKDFSKHLELSRCFQGSQFPDSSTGPEMSCWLLKASKKPNFRTRGLDPV
jgi:hypothetical protein